MDQSPTCILPFQFASLHSCNCGDDGRIQGWRWNELARLKAYFSLPGNGIKPLFDLVNPQHKGPWDAFSPIIWFAVDTKEGSVFDAFGDSCAYCWDVETGKVKMVFKGRLLALFSCPQLSQSNYNRFKGWDCMNLGLQKWKEYQSDRSSKRSEVKRICILD